MFVTGDLEAPITIDEDLRTFLDVEGSVDANITVTQQLRGLVRIGASLLSGRTISAQALTESGIDGQIIINALNVSGTWSGNVTVNSTTLATKPHYSNTGLGGAVGLVPFDLFENECVPTGGAPDPNATTITLAFYGPVNWTSGFPFTVEFSNTGGSSWADDSANWAVISGQGTREVTIEYDGGTTIPHNLDWRIKPVTSGSNKLVCDDVLAATPPATYPFTYIFHTFVNTP